MQFKRQCNGQAYKTAEIILFLLYYELVVKRHKLSCHYKCDYLTNVIS